MEELPIDTAIYIYNAIGKPLIFDIMRYVIEYAMERELEEEDGIVVQVRNKFADVLFGLSVIYHRFAKIEHAIYYLNGKRHGLSRCWADDNCNSLKYEENYNHGERHGKQIYYYTDGSVRILVHYTNGNVDGETIKYNRKGIVIQKTMYADNNIISMVAYHNGNTVVNTTHDGDYSTITCYKEKKITCVIPLFKNKRHGKVVASSYGPNDLVCFYDNGLLHGKVMMWHNPEQLKYEAEYVHGKLEGSVKKWDPMGNLEISAFFVGGKLHGEYKSSHISKGSPIIYNFQYVNGIMNGKCLISKKGVTVFNADMKDGLVDGVIEARGTDGVLMTTAKYSKGMLHGDSIIYSKKGTILHTSTYNHNVLISGAVKNLDIATQLFNNVIRMLSIKELPDIEYEIGRNLVINEIEYEIIRGGDQHEFGIHSDDSSSGDENAVSDSESSVEASSRASSRASSKNSRKNSRKPRTKSESERENESESESHS